MATRETVISKTLDCTVKSTNEFVPKIKWARVLEVIDGNSFWIVTYFAGAVLRFLVELRGIEIPDRASLNSIEKDAAAIIYRELTGLINGEMVSLSGVVWGQHGAIIANVQCNHINVNEYLINQGLTLNRLKHTQVEIVEPMWNLV